MIEPMPGRVLASTAVGERVALTDFPFETLRALLGDLGLQRGSVVRCLVAAPGVMLVERDDGRQIRLDSGWAKLIQVEPVAASSNGSVK
jgi:Fe2+ transport system protein FeoA